MLAQTSQVEWTCITRRCCRVGVMSFGGSHSQPDNRECIQTLSWHAGGLICSRHLSNHCTPDCCGTLWRALPSTCGEVAPCMRSLGFVKSFLPLPVQSKVAELECKSVRLGDSPGQGFSTRCIQLLVQAALQSNSSKITKHNNWKMLIFFCRKSKCSSEKLISVLCLSSWSSYFLINLFESRSRYVAQSALILVSIILPQPKERLIIGTVHHAWLVTF